VGKKKPETELQVLRFAQWYNRGFLSCGHILQNIRTHPPKSAGSQPRSPKFPETDFFYDFSENEILRYKSIPSWTYSTLNAVYQSHSTHCQNEVPFTSVVW
jgi:hypothetical protein